MFWGGGLWARGVGQGASLESCVCALGLLQPALGPLLAPGGGQGSGTEGLVCGGTPSPLSDHRHAESVARLCPGLSPGPGASRWVTRQVKKSLWRVRLSGLPLDPSRPAGLPLPLSPPPSAVVLSDRGSATGLRCARGHATASALGHQARAAQPAYSSASLHGPPSALLVSWLSSWRIRPGGSLETTPILILAQVLPERGD